MANLAYPFNNLAKGWKTSLTAGTPAHILIDPGVTYYGVLVPSADAECHFLFNNAGDTPNAAALTPTGTGKAGISTTYSKFDFYLVAPPVTVANPGGQVSVLLDGAGTAVLYLSRVSPAY
jgi:hypothetical protein